MYYRECGMVNSSSFWLRFIETGTGNNSYRKAPAPANVMMTSRVFPILFELQNLSEMYGFN